MSEGAITRKVLFHEPGEMEKRVRNVHIVIGLALMAIQFLVLSFEDWLFTTGLVFPVFLILVGVVYGLGASKESDRLFLDNIIKPRLENITDEQVTDFLSFRNALRISILVIGYLFTVIFTWIWVTITNLGATNVFGLVVLFPMFALLIPTTGHPIAMVLERTKYKSIRPLMKVERAWIKTLNL